MRAGAPGEGVVAGVKYRDDLDGTGLEAVEDGVRESAQQGTLDPALHGSMRLRVADNPAAGASTARWKSVDRPGLVDSYQSCASARFCSAVCVMMTPDVTGGTGARV